MSEESATWRVTQPPGAARKRTCRHLERARPVTAVAEGCSRCLAPGGSWVNLLACLECGAVGCCDSSPGRHAYEHFAVTGHPLARTLKAGEAWGWCYADAVFLEQG